MVECGRETIVDSSRRRDAQRYALLGAVAGLVAVCAVAVIATRTSSTNLVDKPKVSGAN